MNLHKTLNVVLGFTTIAGIFAGYWLGTSQGQFIFENMNFLLNSERNVETALNLRALERLREGHVEDSIKLMEMRIKSALKYNRVNSATLDCAREYQRKYCKDLCLGIP